MPPAAMAPPPPPQAPSNSGDPLYPELWRACAGPLVTVPRPGDLVFYFPQGHIEQVEASMNQVAQNQMRLYDLPSKLLCRVLNVELKAETETDEVYAQIMLMPEPEQNEVAAEKASSASAATPRPAVRSFCKTLTASDTSTHGGFSVLRRHADECLPPLDMTQSPPTQELVAKDLHGMEWRFRHIFRGQPRRHLLETSWSVFVSSKRLVAGDLGAGRHVAQISQRPFPLSILQLRRCQSLVSILYMLLLLEQAKKGKKCCTNQESEEEGCGEGKAKRDNKESRESADT